MQRTRVTRHAGRRRPLSMSRQSEKNEHDINELDTDERHHEPAESVDPEISAENRGRPGRPIPDAAKGERNERDDDQRIENHAREYGRLRRMQSHDVESI